MHLCAFLQAFNTLTNLHIRVPQGRASPSVKTKQRLVREAMAVLEVARAVFSAKSVRLVLEQVDFDVVFVFLS